MIKGIQVVGVLVGLYLIVQTVLYYRRGNYGVRRAGFLLVLWSLVSVLFVYPPLASLVLPILATQDMVVSVLVVGLVVAFVLISQVYQQAARIERKLTELVQNIAIHDYVREAVNKRENSEEKRADEDAT